MVLALKELLYSKGRFIMIGFIIVLISWLVFILSGLGTGLSALSTGVVSQADITGIVFEEGSEYSLSKSNISSSLSEEVSKQEGVTDTAEISTFNTSVRKEGTANENEKITDVVLIGIEPNSFMQPDIVEGSTWNTSEQTQVIADASLQSEGYSIGDSIEFSGTDKAVTIVGFTENKTLYHQSALYAQTDDFRDIRFSEPELANGAEDSVSGIAIQGDEVNMAALSEPGSGIEYGTKEETIKAIPGYVAENATIMMMLWFLMIISAFILGVFFYVLTNQKTHQFGVLKAIGGSNGFIMRSVVSQVFVLSLISILLGIGLTYLTVLALPETMPFQLETNMVVIYSAVLLVISVLSSLFSVARISKIDPLTALGRIE
ncbi:ABC transporter permease [Lacticigenium naphthae]|uniref:ABC transporter permease n=1 Tax=Lacticigenium naphthae TaxID=515351 RepID=UPI0003F9794F|nr:ABC transporter permease [Lacticigenium naphthae]